MTGQHLDRVWYQQGKENVTCDPIGGSPLFLGVCVATEPVRDRRMQEFIPSAHRDRQGRLKGNNTEQRLSGEVAGGLLRAGQEGTFQQAET